MRTLKPYNDNEVGLPIVSAARSADHSSVEIMPNFRLESLSGDREALG